MQSKIRFVALTLSLLALGACSGGGGGDGNIAAPAPGSPGVLSAVPVLSLTPQSMKTFHFTWADVGGETEYRLLENPDGASGFTQVAAIAANATSYDLAVSLPKRVDAGYILQACDASGCIDSAPVFVVPKVSGAGKLAEAVGYMKASNTGGAFGNSVALSADGNTLAVGAHAEGSKATGVNGDQTADAAGNNSGAVYVFTRSGDNIWTQQAYVKASNTEAEDHFGFSVALSGDGNTLAVGAILEDSDATGIDGDQSNNLAGGSGAVYVYTRSGTTWSQQAYVKASNTESDDAFGSSVALSGDGNTLAVGAPDEDSSATGINGNQASNSATNSGAVYVFTRGGTMWSQQAYVKASNTDIAIGTADNFGGRVALSADGNTLAVGASGEDGPNDSVANSGAVYVFTRSGTTWNQQAYVKASNEGAQDRFGLSVALSADGDTLAVGASGEAGTNNLFDHSGAVYVFTRSGASWSQQGFLKTSRVEVGDVFGTSVALSADGNTLVAGANGEDSNATGINGNQFSDSADGSGAVYVFTRSGTTWSQRAYVKAPNTDANDVFGFSVALSGDGNTLAAGAPFEASRSTGINGDQSDNTGGSVGAVYLY